MDDKEQNEQLVRELGAALGASPQRVEQVLDTLDEVIERLTDGDADDEAPFNEPPREALAPYCVACGGEHEADQCQTYNLDDRELMQLGVALFLNAQQPHVAAPLRPLAALFAEVLVPERSKEWRIAVLLAEDEPEL